MFIILDPNYLEMLHIVIHWSINKSTAVFVNFNPSSPKPFHLQHFKPMNIKSYANNSALFSFLAKLFIYLNQRVYNVPSCLDFAKIQAINSHTHTHSTVNFLEYQSVGNDSSTAQLSKHIPFSRIFLSSWCRR